VGKPSQNYGVSHSFTCSQT